MRIDDVNYFRRMNDITFSSLLLDDNLDQCGVDDDDGKAVRFHLLRDVEKVQGKKLWVCE